jgi:hypothetical protein
MSMLIEGRAEFKNNSPELTPEAAQERFRAWFADEEILSELVVVGRIIPNEADHRLLLNLHTHQNVHRSYDEPIDTFFLGETVLDLQRAFENITTHDKRRVGVNAEGSTRIQAGKMAALPWHADHTKFVRWGASNDSTIGANIKIRRSNSSSCQLDSLFDDETL